MAKKAHQLDFKCIALNEGIWHFPTTKLIWHKNWSYLNHWLDFPGGTVVKNVHEMQETRVQSLGGEVPLEESMATHSSILAWEIPWTEELGGL